MGSPNSSIQGQVNAVMKVLDMVVLHLSISTLLLNVFEVVRESFEARLRRRSGENVSGTVKAHIIPMTPVKMAMTPCIQRQSMVWPTNPPTAQH